MMLRIYEHDKDGQLTLISEQAIKYYESYTPDKNIKIVSTSFTSDWIHIYTKKES